MEIKIKDDINNESKYKVGDVFVVNGSLYILHCFNYDPPQQKYILHQYLDGEVYGSNGYHNSIKELISDLEQCVGIGDFGHYSQDYYDLVLTRKVD